MSFVLEVHAMQAFVVLSEELHFSQAARRLGMTQPAFSLLVRRLEERVGARLVERTTRHVRLTEAGRLFLGKTRLALSQMDEAVTLARLAASGARGRLSIGTIQSALYLRLGEAVLTFKQMHPEIEVSLTHIGSPDQIQAVIEGRLDVGIVRPSLPQATLQFDILTREGFAVAAPLDHPVMQQKSVALASLADESFIDYLSATGDVFPQFVAPYCRRAGFEPRFVAETNNTTTTLCLVAARMGIAIVPAWLANIVPHGIGCRPIPEIPAMIELAAAYVPEIASPHVYDFIKILKNAMPG